MEFRLPLEQKKHSSLVSFAGKSIPLHLRIVENAIVGTQRGHRLQVSVPECDNQAHFPGYRARCRAVSVV